MDQYLIDEYLQAKENEKTAKEKRIELENEIIKEVNNTLPEGTINITTAQHKITVINSLKREIDMDVYCTLDIPDELQYITMVPKIELKRLRHTERLNPDMVTPCITTKPNKPRITIKEVS
jgi:hypothetical protein